MHENTKALLEVIRLSVDVAIRAALVLLVVLVIVHPPLAVDRINGALSSLREAGVHEVELFGVLVKIPQNEAGAVNEGVTQLADRLALLEGRNKTLESLLTCQAAGSCTDDQQGELAAIMGASPGSDTDPELATELQEAVYRTSQLAAEQSERPAEDPDWVVVVGADRTVRSAEDELKRLKSAGYDARIVRKGNYWRTIAVLGSREAAQAADDALAELMGRNVYAVSLRQWCPSAELGPEGFRVCG